MGGLFLFSDPVRNLYLILVCFANAPFHSWNPNVITDSVGEASVEFYNNSITEHFNVSAAGITPGGTSYVLDTDF